MLKNIRSLRTKMSIAVASASFLVVCALAVALFYMQQISQSFDRFLDQDQARLQGYSEMYAQGLQGGQALRNIVLNPSNGKAYDNLEKANTSFDEAYAKALSLATNNPTETALLKTLKEDWAVTQAAKIKVRDLAKTNQVEAVSILNKEETPNWRKVRETLLSQIDKQKEAVGTTRKDISGQVRQAWILSLILGAAAVLLGSLVVMVVSESVKRSLDAVSSSMNDLARGEGDLTKRMTVDTADEVGRTGRAFNQFMEGLQNMIRQVRENADAVAASASKLSHSAANVSRASGEQSDAASSAASAVEEMTTSVENVAESADHVRKLSQDSYECTQQGNQSLGSLVSEIEAVRLAVNDIAASVGEFVKSTNTITGMTKQVKDIADQTNLLALNAAIEAARAGEQGRGFAVVADEVRKLAEKSAQSATEIDAVTKTLAQQSVRVEKSIDEGLSSLRTGENMLEKVAGAFAEVNTSVSQANAGVDNITQSVKEHTLGSSDISRHMERIAQMAEQNSHVIQETSSHAAALESLSAELRGLVSRFRV